MKKISIMMLMMFLSAWWLCASGQSLKKLEGIDFSQVKITDRFWRPKIEVVVSQAIPACIHQTETVTPRIRNFEKVARGAGERHEGIYYDDSDVYKAIEAMAYALHSFPDPELEKKADEWIDKIVAAQLPDGYLFTYYTLNNPEERWTDMEKHEAYCAGHLIEAAVAYHRATGKRKLLDAAIRFADHIDAGFRQAGRPWVPGHQEIELALVKLFRETGNENYLELAEWFLDQRGRGLGRGRIWENNTHPEYCQDQLPVREQTKITGHAVRAMYMYTGIADVAAMKNDSSYLPAMRAVWEDVVHRNLYLTGGIGSSGRNEGFSRDYDLPNEDAYCETCASVGMVFWNQRMNWLSGDGKYIDVLERSLYNGALAGVALDGKKFFYANPLASRGGRERREWFGTACCPSNISRLITSLGSYIYGRSADELWIHLYIGSSLQTSIAQTELDLSMESALPWQGRVSIRIEPKEQAVFKLRLRIPGWTLNRAVPGDLYTFADESKPEKTVIKINGDSVSYQVENGYAVVERAWKRGDLLELEMPLKPRKVKAREEVAENRGRLALQYGPLVYCFEGEDNGGKAFSLLMDEKAVFSPVNHAVLQEQVLALRGTLPVFGISPDGRSLQKTRAEATAVPYYAWCNRGPGEMQVWLPLFIRNFFLY